MNNFILFGIQELMRLLEPKNKMEDLEMAESTPIVIHACPKCGFQVSDKIGISMFFGWRKSFRTTMNQSYKKIPQSWCVRCRSKEATRYE